MSFATTLPLRSWTRWFDMIDSETGIGVGSGLLLLIGLACGQPVLAGAGGVGCCMIARSAIVRRRGGGGESAKNDRPQPPARQATGGDPERRPDPAPPRKQRKTGNEQNQDDLVDEMIADRRYSLLLRPETACQISQEQYVRAIRELDDAMVLTPAGAVLVGVAAERETLGHEATTNLLEAGSDSIVRVEPCYLDRFTVTNADFQRFVDAGGYDALEFWPEEALPALFDFVDQTGVTAPRYWRDGRHADNEQLLPVVGVSWYEAVAYARWVGKRLPTDAEWTKSCAWPIESAPGRVAQRRYPWGESFDTRRANLWSAGHGRPAPVDAYPDGATVGGLEQMVGNVWEWTSSTLDETTPYAVKFPSALRTVRGGAYNTYFENQATCHFQSAEHPLARRPNIGIRLAISMDVLASSTAAHAV